MRKCGAWGLGALALLFFGLAGPGCGNSESKVPGTTVTITSTPEEGARLLVGGLEKGLTPVTLNDQPPGWLDIIVQKDGFKREVDRVEVVPGPPLQFEIAMTPVVGYVSVDSEPFGADVLVNGVSIGKTPLFKYPMAVGKYDYELRLPNYYPIQSTVEVVEDFQYDLRHTLKPMEATVSILSRPSSASIRVNNELRTEKTPVKIRLAPGLYIIGVQAKGYVEAEERLTLAANEERTVNLTMLPGDVPEGMVLVPAGPFIMGANESAPDESPRREVNLDAYYIDKFEVTNARFKAVFPAHTFPKGQEEFPVSNVSWNQATEYARSIGKRLPTEAEWEKAARGTDGREFPWGRDFNPDFCNTKERDIGDCLKPGSSLGGVSPYGCFDMAGNVYEWVQDWYEAYPGNTQVTKDYGQIYRILRGGAYTEPQFQARCARRHFDRMDAKKPTYGFRCAKDVAP